MSAASGTVRTKKAHIVHQKPSENPRLPQKRASVQSTASRRVLSDLSNINVAPKNILKPKGDVGCGKKKTAKVKPVPEELDEIEIGPPQENDEDKWVEPPYFKALTSILSGNLVIPSGELATADIFPEPEMEISRRPPYSIPTGLFPATCSPVIDICEITPFDVDEDFRKYID